MDEPVEIRIATPSDASAVRDLTCEAYAKWIPKIGREPKPMIADYDAAVRDHRIDLLYVGGDLAALVETIDQGGRLLIENIAVGPRYQRRGLGSRLMAHAEAIAISQGCREIWLYTNRRFEGNVELYSRLGYQVDDETPIDRGLVRTNMSKKLP